MSGTDASAEFDGPMFTVAIPVYNREDMVERTLESVYAQSFTDYEIVCVNDGSKDGSLEVLRRHEPRVRVVDQENTGLAGARNTGAREARGRYVIFLDSDDLFLPWSLEVLAEAAKGWAVRNGGRLPAMVSGQFTPFAEDEVAQGWERLATAERSWDDYLSSLNARSIAPSATALLVDALRDAGYGEQTRVMFEEVDLWFKVGARPGFVFLDAPTVMAYRVGHASMMGNMQKQLDGLEWMLDRVRKGVYGERKREMNEILAVYAKGAAFRSLHTRDRRRGFVFYRKAFATLLKRGDFKFLLAYPLLLLLGRGPQSGSMRGLSAQTVADE